MTGLLYLPYLGELKDPAVGKQVAFDLGLANVYRRSKAERFFNGVADFEGMEKAFPCLWRYARALNASRWKKSERVANRIADYLRSFGGFVFFMTFTFTDKALSRTSEDTRRQYVRKTLKKFFKGYLANVDYGTDKGREHYHAVGFLPCYNNADKIKGPLAGDLAKSYWEETLKLGFADAEPVRNRADSPIKLGKYVAKLTNHALKKHIKQPRLIFSRGLSKVYSGSSVPDFLTDPDF